VLAVEAPRRVHLAPAPAPVRSAAPLAPPAPAPAGPNDVGFGVPGGSATPPLALVLIAAAIAVFARSRLATRVAELVRVPHAVVLTLDLGRPG